MPGRPRLIGFELYFQNLEPATAFYRDVQKGRFTTDPAEQARIERDIFAATAEGRVR